MGLVDRLVEPGQALAAALESAARNEARHGLDTVASGESAEGAGRFAAGEGRHGEGG